MEKIFIKNRKNQKIAVIVETAPNQKGVVFVMHGLGGFKEQPHIEIVAKTFLEHGYTAVRFDTTNTLGESDGVYENATITSYYEDLEDLIAWAKSQSWYQEPFVLSGHSLGGISTAMYAEKYPDKILGLVPLSPVVSGKLSLEREEKNELYKRWKETGWKEEISISKPGVVKRLPWSHMEDRLKYDLLTDAANLSMPVLLIVGENDTSTPPEHVRKLFAVLTGPKEMHVLKDAPHTFRSVEELAQIKDIVSAWIDKSLQTDPI